MSTVARPQEGIFNQSSLREAPGWIVSLGVHLLIMLMLLAVKMTVQNESQVALLESTLEDVQNETEFEASSFDQKGTGEDVTALSSMATGGSSGAGAAVSGAGSVSDATEQRVSEGITGGQQVNIRMVDDLGPGLPAMNELTEAVSGSGKNSGPLITGSSTENVAGTGGGVGAAIDRLTWEIAQSLREKKTTAVWLFDQSLSLKDRRDAIAERFEMVYRQLESLGEGGKGALQTMAATYGEGFKFLTDKPVDDVKALIPKVREIPDDPSGKENVFSAVKQIVNRLKKEKDKNRSILIFIITDEKGDDAEEHLEEAITMCRRTGIKVYSIGNAALFGREKGYVAWKFPEGDTVDLEVDAGPETVEPEALQLGFFGGSGGDLSRMSSGYGPYALTRICKETGGQFLIAQEDDKGTRFDPAIMRNYQPDYRPIREYWKSVEKNKAKFKLIEAAKRTKIDNVMIPRLDFPAYNDDVLRSTITEAQKPAAETDYKIKQVLDLLQQGEKERDKILEPRWRAAYDLAIGRALAMEVRIFGYNSMLAEMKSTPKPFKNKNSNKWQLEPSKEINAGQLVKKLEKQASMYLKRVIDEHPGTPWAKIAEREYTTPMGWQWKEVQDPRTFAANTSQAEARRQIQLAEDRAREEAAKRPQATPRAMPKL
ncbi:MAG: VWA domain-containing protein [Planctomycetes bacterium]|nr:VWA domain-containing protein [Planctomycetota bacterium]